MSERPLPSVSVVIPTFNRRERLPELLDSLVPEPAAEIVVVVSTCHDGSLELLEERARGDDRLRPMFVAEPGQTRALQAGVERAEGDVVLMLDDDVLVEPGLVEGHARHHAGAEGLVVLGYMPVALPERRRRGEFAGTIYAADYERTCEEYERDPDSVLRGLWAGNLSLRHGDCLRVGVRPGAGMPAGYGYHEDRDFGLRCQAAGLRGVFDRRLRARHLYEKSPAAFLRAARSSGETQAAVHVAHEEMVGPLDPESFERSVSYPGRLLVRWARRGAVRAPIMALLHAIAAIAGTLRIFRVESYAGYVMGTIEQQRGAMNADAQRARGS